MLLATKTSIDSATVFFISFPISSLNTQTSDSFSAIACHYSLILFYSGLPQLLTESLYYHITLSFFFQLDKSLENLGIGAKFHAFCRYIRRRRSKPHGIASRYCTQKRSRYIKRSLLPLSSYFFQYAPSPLMTAGIVLNRILRSVSTLRSLIYCISSLIMPLKSISLLPLICQ